MKATKTIISTLREAPNDAVIASHQLMMRSGLIRKLGNGLYAYMPFGFRSLMKVEKIIREELDNAGLLEIKPTVIVRNLDAGIKCLAKCSLHRTARARTW